MELKIEFMLMSTISFVLLDSVMRIVTKQLRLQSRSFRYKVALYLSYLHIKFVGEI